MRIVVLFNLKPGVDPADYEAWAASEDAPAVRALPSVAAFRVHALTGLMFGAGTPPFRYVEVIDIADPEGFGADIATPRMQAIAARFRDFAEAPLFLTTREIGA